MALDLHRREQWQLTSQPVVGPPAKLGSIMRIVIHYTAAAKVDPDTASYLRSIQRDYTLNRGFSVGYNWAVCQLGRVWELRGLDIQCAANKGFNDTSLAILVLVDGANPANGRMVATIRELVAQIRISAPGATRIVGHQQIGSTACPGAGLQAQVIAGTFEPVELPPVDPDPPATSEETVRYIAIRVPGDKDRAEALVAHDGAGIHIIGFSTPGDRDRLINAYGAVRVDVTAAQYDSYLLSSQV